MAELKEWQRHIRHPHADHVNTALCGVAVSQWDKPFEDVDHAFLSLQQESRLQPCPDCAKVVIVAFQVGDN